MSNLSGYRYRSRTSFSQGLPIHYRWNNAQHRVLWSSCTRISAWEIWSDSGMGKNPFVPPPCAGCVSKHLTPLKKVKGTWYWTYEASGNNNGLSPAQWHWASWKSRTLLTHKGTHAVWQTLSLCSQLQLFSSLTALLRRGETSLDWSYSKWELEFTFFFFFLLCFLCFFRFFVLFFKRQNIRITGE